MFGLNLSSKKKKSVSCLKGNNSVNDNMTLHTVLSTWFYMLRKETDKCLCANIVFNRQKNTSIILNANKPKSK